MFYDNLKRACKLRNTSVTAVLKKIGIGTANGTYWKNGSVPASDIVVKLAEFLEVTTDFLLLGIDSSNETESSFVPQSDDVRLLLGYYNELRDIYKGIVIGEAKALSELEKNTKTEGEPNNKKNPKNRAKNTVVIDLYTLPASAGTGVMLDDSDIEPIEIDADYLSDTKNYYAIRVSGDSMEPDFQDEDIVLVEAAPKVDEGEIGIFILNNEEGFIKKLGHGCLISLNPKYEPIELDESDELLCRGRVLGVLDI